MTCKKLEHGPSGDQALPERAPWINFFKYKYKCQDLREAIRTHELNCRLSVKSRLGFFQPFSQLLAAFSLRKW